MSAGTLHNQSSGNLWNKFRCSTKSLSTSLSHLSVRSETDGDTASTTLVHKALVKYYKNQEPFQGFPGWLGHKEDLPDESKILKRQMEGRSSKSSGKSDGNSTSFGHIRKVSAGYTTKLLNNENDGRSKSVPQSRTAGMSFQSIYSDGHSSAVGRSKTADSQARKPSPPSAVGASQRVSSANTAQRSQPVRTQSSSSMLMRDRLKKQGTRSTFEFS